MEQRDDAGELLWKYIEELKAADAPDGVNFVARTPADPEAVSALLPMADAAYAALRAGPCAADPEARRRLAGAIEQDRRLCRGRARIRTGLRRLRPGGRLSSALALALCASFAVLFFRWQAEAPTMVLHARSMIRDHQEFVEHPARVMVRGPDPEVVARGLSARLGFAVAPVDLSLAGATLIGGRRCELDGRPIAFFMYRADSVPVSVYEVQTVHCKLPGLAAERLDGRRFLMGTNDNYHVLAWRSKNRLYVFVSALPEARMADLALHVDGDADSW